MVAVKKKNIQKFSYDSFDRLDGTHPLKKHVPNAFIEYPARIRKGGRLKYFNFDLAKEMGLIDANHPNEMNEQLMKKVIETFGIIIINEWDQLNSIKFKQNEILKNKYMATRYLQLQHDDKKGLNSGDGRSIWNGQVKYKGKTWDVSSGGTGATKLSPATAKYKKYFKSGDPTISYGCGYAEVEEGLEAAIFSEILKRNNITTEQTLAVIQYEKNYSINIRAHQNLLRPSHFFNHLKQSNYDELKNMVDFYIEQQRNTIEYHKCPYGNEKYNYFLEVICETFAKMAATFESEYIFCWLDWDGDNILMDGGIIDYGSVRQFGLFHSEYRYDDIDRYSTTILEQKSKAKYIVQSFIQAIDYIKNKKKKNITQFRSNKLLKKFEQQFIHEKNSRLLKKLGLNNKHVDQLLERYPKKVEQFSEAFSYFERAKSVKGLVEVADGITRDAIFCMRDLLRELPQLYLIKKENISEEDFIDILRSNYATDEDVKLTSYRKKKIKQYQNTLWNLIDAVSLESHIKKDKLLLEMSMRASIINKRERITGDSITHVVTQILNQKPQLSVDELYELVDNFATAQHLIPDVKKDHNLSNNEQKKLILNLFKIVKDHREGL